MSLRSASVIVIGLSATFLGIVVLDQLLLTVGLDLLGIGLLMLMVIALVVASSWAVLQRQVRRMRALVPAGVLLVCLVIGWPAAVRGGGWLREAWMRSELAAAEAVLAQAGSRGTDTVAVERLPASFRATCARLRLDGDSAGSSVVYCQARRPLVYAYDPRDQTEEMAWAERTAIAPHWYRLLR